MVAANGTWTGAFRLDPPSVAEAHGAVGMRVGQQALAEVVNPLVQLVWNVGRLESRKNTHDANPRARISEEKTKIKIITSLLR